MAAALTGLAHDLTVKLPLTLAALRDGIIDIDKARTIAVTCWPLTPEQARPVSVPALASSNDLAGGVLPYIGRIGLTSG